MLAHKLEEVARVWPSIGSVFSVPKTEEEYDRLVGWLDDLVEEVGEDENHPLATLMETLGTLIETYETETIPEPDVDPAETLLFLMEEHGLGKNDLPELGGEDVISEILSGKRVLDIRQIQTLGRRFNVSPRVFLH